MKTPHKITLIFFAFFLINFGKPEIQLANIYHKEIDVEQYLISEKLDGIRARWDGKNLISKNGNKINAPNWFVKNFPDQELDGELWTKRGRFEEISTIVRDEIPNEKEWQKVKFMIFDLPKSKEVFAKRYEILQKIITNSGSEYLKLIAQFTVKNNQELMRKLEEVEKMQGEGLMLHKKDSLYQNVRNDDLLKLKPYFDEEAIVLAHIAGTGKLKGKTGAILVENSDKIQFKIGSGFTDFQRENPPQIGKIITYKFYGKTKNNIPRFPVFLRIREKE